MYTLLQGRTAEGHRKHQSQDEEARVDAQQPKVCSPAT